ncbi:21510_t:CDS:2, partial [Entrophospora sp. SA101]
ATAGIALPASVVACNVAQGYENFKEVYDGHAKNTTNESTLEAAIYSLANYDNNEIK